jgi:hypothetical protein
MKKTILIAVASGIIGAAAALGGQTNEIVEVTNPNRDILRVWLRCSGPWYFDQVALLLLLVAIGFALTRRANAAAFILRAGWCLLAFAALVGMWRAAMRVFAPEHFCSEMQALLPFTLIRIATSSFLALLLTCLHVLIDLFKKRNQSLLLDLLGLVGLVVATAFAGLSMFILGRFLAS